jgi:hypothetical protein
MTDEQKPSDELQFDKVIPQGSATVETTCTNCKSLLSGNYFAVKGQVVCASCKSKIETEFTSGNPMARVLKALAFGIPAGIVGAGIFYAIRALTGYEFGLIAILIGYMVGFAVLKGSQHRGGLPYQIMAVLITYMAICSTYVPLIINDLKSDHVAQLQQNEPSTEASATLANTAQSHPSEIVVTPVWYIIAFIISLAVPFLMGFQNVIGILIIGFGVFEAWRINTKVKFEFEGPFELKNNVSN